MVTFVQRIEISGLAECICNQRLPPSWHPGVTYHPDSSNLGFHNHIELLYCILEGYILIPDQYQKSQPLSPAPPLPQPQRFHCPRGFRYLQFSSLAQRLQHSPSRRQETESWAQIYFLRAEESRKGGEFVRHITQHTHRSKHFTDDIDNLQLRSSSSVATGGIW